MVKMRDRLDVPFPGNKDNKEMTQWDTPHAEPVIEKLAGPLSGFMKRFNTRHPRNASKVSTFDWNPSVGSYSTHEQRYRLTDRHMEILSLVAEGMTNKEIGSQLNISDQTVKNHMVNIMNKLDAHDRTHAVGIAYRVGLLDLRIAVG
jgi:DNA-binding CsgD family transcriptional regulator